MADHDHDIDRDPSSGRFVEGNHARDERVLTPEELEKVEKLVAGGAKDPGVAKGCASAIGCSSI